MPWRTASPGSIMAPMITSPNRSNFGSCLRASARCFAAPVNFALPQFLSLLLSWIEVCVNRVRRKSDGESSKPLLHTRRGAGYLFGPLSDAEAADAADESALPRQRAKGVSPARKSHA